MKTILKISILFLAIHFSCQTLIAQKASNVLENGLHVKNGEKIFLQYGNKILKYCVAKSLVDITNPPDFTTLPDSIIFLIDKNEANIYLYPPLNPLKNSYTNEIKELPDPINEAAATALGSIIDILKSTFDERSKEAILKNDKEIESDLITIQTLLKNDFKKEIKSIFDTLRNLTFFDEKNTIDSLARCNKEIIIIQNHFNKVGSLVKVTKELIDNYSVNKDNPSITKFTYYSFLNYVSIKAEEQKKRLKNLLIAYKLVKTAQETASTCGSKTGLKWCQELPSLSSKEGKIFIYTLTIKGSGYKLSDKDEIISSETNEIIKRTIIAREFRRFITEVSIGTAFTFFEYPIYGTTSDSSGIKTDNQYIASPEKSSVRNLNITTMVNFNYFIPNSNIHPLFQIGIGVNSGMPTLLSGVGLRLTGIGSESKSKESHRIAITGGIAMTWIKELDKLKVGDQVSGTADIENDLKYQFSWPPRLYIGLQYSF